MVFGPSDARKPCRGRGHLRDCVAEKGMPAELGRCLTAQKGVTKLPEGLCSREGKVGDGFVLVISIVRWNQMHIGSVPWNNKMVTVH